MPSGVNEIRRLALNGHELVITTPRIRIDHREPAENWSYIDAAGHVHAWSAESEGGPWPTLEKVTDSRRGCETCLDEIESYHLACRACGETIWPGHYDSYEFRPGGVTYEIDGEPVGLDEAAAFAEQVPAG